jgi:peptide/nickel transport system substrate-binding protein
MKRNKRVIAVILGLFMCLALPAACGKSTVTQDVPAPGASPSPAGADIAGHIDIIVDATALTLVNPMIPAALGGPSSWAYILVHDRLVTRGGAPGAYNPALATDWHTEDYQTFTFNLRDDVTFHNGDPFTSEDVVWTYEYAKDNPSAPTNSTWNSMESIRAVDPYTVEIVWSAPNFDLLQEISGNFQGILNHRAYEENPEDPTWGHIGTGPFKIAGYSPNDYYTFERFEDFWGEQPPTGSLTFLTVPEMATRRLMLANGEAQVCFQMPSEDLDALAGDSDFQIFKVTINEPVTLGYNDQGDATVKDINFRKAIAYALNTDEIAEVALGNWGMAPWDGSVWGPDTEYRLEGLPKWEQNLDLAREYLEKSVYGGEVIELMTTSDVNIRAAEVVQDQLKQIGVAIDVRSMDLAGFFAEHRYDPESTRQLHIFSQAMAHSVTSALNALTSKSVSRQNCNDPYVIELADRYRYTGDPETRRDISYEIQEKYFYEMLATQVLFWRIQGITAVNGIGGMELSSDQFEHNLRGIYWDLSETSAGLRR